MGNFQTNSFEHPIVWRRGERGWGSGPGSVYSSVVLDGENYEGPDDIYGEPIYQNITDFQQHPAPFSGDWTDETAADMFLNWIYRTINTGKGFLNITWKPRDLNHSLVCIQVANGCDEATHADYKGVPTNGASGDARFIWMNVIMSEIFDNHPQWP